MQGKGLVKFKSNCPKSVQTEYFVKWEEPSSHACAYIFVNSMEGYFLCQRKDLLFVHYISLSSVYIFLNCGCCCQVRGVSESTHCVLLSALNQLMCMLD